MSWPQNVTWPNKPTMEDWKEKVEKNRRVFDDSSRSSATVTKVSNQLAIAYWFESVKSADRGIVWTHGHVCFSIFFNGEEKTQSLHYSTHTQVGRGFIGDLGSKVSTNVFPDKIGKAKVLQKNGTNIVDIKVQVLTRDGKGYELTFGFSK